MMKRQGKPPLPKSPIRLRSRRVLRLDSVSLQTPQVSLTTSKKPTRRCDGDETDLRPEYQLISSELQALTKMVNEELGKGKSTKSEIGTPCANLGSLFERGRFYEEYSARRNEKLKRKSCCDEVDAEETKTPYCLGVKVQSSKRRDTKKLESLKKSVATAYSVENSENPKSRYLLRSMNKENNKKTPLGVNNCKPPVFGSERKTVTRKGTRRI